MGKMYVSWETTRYRVPGEFKKGQERLIGQVEAAHAMGFKGIQFMGFYSNLPFTTERQRKYLKWAEESVSDIMDYDTSELKEILDKYDMKRTLHLQTMIFVDRLLDYSNKVDYDDFKKQVISGVNFVKELGGNVVSYHPPYMEPPQYLNAPRNFRNLVCKYHDSFTDEERNRVRERYQKLIGECISATEGSGVRIAVETFPPMLTVFDSADDYLTFAEALGPRGGLLIELGHLFNEGYDLRDYILRLGNKIFDVHAKDAIRRVDGSQCEEWIEQVERETSQSIGDLDINWAETIEALKEIDYSGLVNLELWRPVSGLIGSRYIIERLIEGDNLFRNYFIERVKNAKA